ncbi:hypothetical protein SeMB42_g05984 [Synchytrium endobioticum]|uniref:Uncharacterized protein n=1 Tax=Synchytrium endobioticum TaxID=286115 RepID=A0A507CRA2_9FUNG|nr:hypothetical protein SeMB42_g05984 [Synchytrium endobioticum]TPX41669.1 hypothetical protein SeLEV6574_g05974 [Synchytrium endobioticum]
MVMTGRFIITFIILGLRSARTLAQNCILTVPANPLTAAGLATPYQVSGAATCQQQTTPSFVEATILDPLTGALSIYNPLVINKGDTPGIPPVVPNLPANAVVGIWFGTNAATITLAKSGGANSLTQGNCVNGLGASIFGQFASCNGAQFFAAITKAGAKIAVPPLGTGLNGKTCYTTRSFEVVDMDPSDNVVASYLVLPNGKIAQATAANKAKFPNATEINNGSDNLLLDLAMRPALGCTAFTAPDLTNPGATKGSLALNEIQAAALQAGAVATVPPNDPMVLVNGAVSAGKLNLYRTAVNQVAVNPNPANLANFSKNFCLNYNQVGAPSIKNDMAFTKGKPSPAADTAVDLFTFLCQRFSTSFSANGLNCVGLLNVTSPVTAVMNAQGITTDCTFNF